MFEGIPLTIREALIQLTVMRRKGQNAYLEFRCETCKKPNRIPNGAEGNSSVVCGRCNAINFINEFIVKVGF